MTSREPRMNPADLYLRRAGYALLLGLAFQAPMPAASWAQGIWPERAENLQVLPADFPPDRLRAVMQGFTRSLGVRCSYCHVGVDGEPLSTFDFASDEVPAKTTARQMLEMLGDINQHLEGIERSGDQPVNMWCQTCHSGKPRPMTLTETLAEARREGGSAAVLTRFATLRGAFYGGNQYDFRAPNVLSTAMSLVNAGDTTAGRALLERNVADYPDWWASHERLGDLHRATGDEETALQWYRRAVALAPEQPRLLQKLGGATTAAANDDTDPEATRSWEVFHIDDLSAARAEQGRPWLEFLRVPDLFAGVYEIAAGGTDGQTPHAQDEVYYVTAGRATLVVDGERVSVSAGSVVYVAKEVDHRFEEVEEELTVLVFFATPGGA